MKLSDQWKITFWRNSVWVTSAFLWATWLMHDVANIAVYLPRQLKCNAIIYCNYLFYNSIILHFLNSWWTNSKSCFR